MQFENPMTFVRSLKGAPASVLWALVFTRQMMTALELQQWTGYKGDNLTVALRLLVDLGWIVARSTRGPWGLAEGRQLPLMQAFFDGGDQLLGETPIKSDSGSLIVVNVESEESEKFRATTLTNKGVNPIKSDSGSTVSVKTIVKDDADVDLCLAELKAGGIYGKKAAEIAEDWHITVEDIRAQFAWAKSEAWDNPNGMVIYRLLNHVCPPPLEQRKPAVEKLKPTMKDWLGAAYMDSQIKHSDDCECIDCRRLHPENYCTYRVRLSNRYNHKEQLSGECGARVEPGHRYCVNHLKYESEEP